MTDAERIEKLEEALTKIKNLSRHAIETAQRDNWTSPGLEFGFSSIELECERALGKLDEANYKNGVHQSSAV